MTASDAADKHRIPVIDRMMEVLAMLERWPDGASIRQLAEALEVPRSTVYRITNTLRDHGVVRRTGDGGYTLGPRLLGLASHVKLERPGLALAARALPLLERLAASQGEGCKLSVRDDGMVLVVAAAQGRRSYALTAMAGQRLPLHCGAAGKVLLAGMEGAAREAVLSGDMAAFTPRTLTDPVRLRRELARIRRQGWSHDPGEFQPNVEAFAAPVCDAAGEVVGAVSMPFLAGRDATDRTAMCDAVVETACAISADLCGHTGRFEASLADGFPENGSYDEASVA